MTTFSTRRRQGFDLPREEGGGLGVYSLPAPGPVTNNAAEQVSRVLSAVGSTIANVASLRRENQAELDRTMLGVAEEVYQSKSAALQSRITNDPNLPVDDEGVSAYVSGLVSETVADSGIDNSDRAREYLSNRLTGVLNTQAFAARDARRAQVLGDAKLDKAAAYAAVDDPREIDADMKALDPNVSDSEIQAYRLNAAMGMAIAGGDKGKIESLLSTVDDTRAAATVRATLQSNIDEKDRETKRLAIEAGQEAVAGALRDHPLRARAVLEAIKGTVPATVYDSLASRVDQAENERHAETVGRARTSVFNSLVEQGPEAAQKAFDGYVASGLLTNAQRPAFAAEAQQYATAKYQARASDIQIKLNSGEVSPGDAMGQLDGMMVEMEERNARAVSDPYSFGAVDPGVSAGVVRDAQRIAAAAAEQAITTQAIDLGAGEVRNGGQWVPQDITLPSGTLTAKEQADAIIEKRWGEIQKQTQDPGERITMLTRDLALVPGGTSPVISTAIAGMPSLAYSAASEQDPDKRAKLFRDLSSARGTFEAVYAINPEVANRHLARESDAEVVDYIRLALDTIPADDTAAIRTAMGAVRSPKRFSEVRTAPATRKLAEAAVKAAGLNGAPLPLTEEAKDRIATLSVGLGMTPERAAAEVTRQLRDAWQVRKGQLIRTGDARSGSRLDANTLEEILLETVPAGERAGLRLGQEPNGGWLLVDEMGLPATEFLSGAEALGALAQAQEFGSGLTQMREDAIRKWLDSETRDPPNAPTAFGPGSPIIGRIGVGVMNTIKSRTVRSATNSVLRGYAQGQINSTEDPIVKAARIVGGRMIGVGQKPEMIDVNSLTGRGIPGL